MATFFASLPIVDLSILSSPKPSLEALNSLSKDLSNVFSTTGFAYLINAPLSFSHKDVFGLAHDFFHLEPTTKMSLAKQTFVPSNSNIYRGYFPPQPAQQDNLKEGFEIGPAQVMAQPRQQRRNQRFKLSESNVWPSERPVFRSRLELLHLELQSLSSTLLSLLAVSLGKPADYFSFYLVDSLSTLRLLHYPQTTIDSNKDRLCCTSHTDSGILTLLHQDPTGGFEVLNSQGEWIPAPYVPESIVVNIGDLMSQISGGRFVATMHRVRAGRNGGGESGLGRLSVPFFFEPGEDCVIEGIAYGTHVRRKMGTWVEYDDQLEKKQLQEESAAITMSA